MSNISKFIESMFRDTSAREVVDLATVIELMARDYAIGAIDEEGIRAFLKRNRLYLNILLTRFAKVNISLEDFIEKIIEVVVVEAITGKGGGLSTTYTFTVLKRVMEKRAKEEPKII